MTLAPSASNMPKIVLLVRVIGVAKIVVDADCLDDACDGLHPQCGDASRYDGSSATWMLAQFIIESADTFFVGVHLIFPVLLRREKARAAIAARAEKPSRADQGVSLFSNATALMCRTTPSCFG
jgi:hypothetical protein